MKLSLNVAWCSSLILLGLSSIPVSAQISPDGSLPTNITSPDSLNFTIENGARSGTNLFHSFQEFSIPTNGSAVFNNAADVQNIFSRVTGGNISNIDGLLRANGGANLFLLNPAGIMFGPNARLDIGGSFFGTTAHTLQFADGVEFSAINPTQTPLLTVNVPVGLQMGQASGTLTVQGTGHRIAEGVFIPYDRSQNPTGLQVSAGHTLALIGNEVNFSGGVLTTNGGGHLEVGSVSDGQVQLNAMGSAWVGDYSAASQLNDIHLARQSLLDASGSNGSIQIQGQNIHFSEGSFALIHNLGSQQVGGININATETLTLTGNTSDSLLGSVIGIINLGSGRSGDITLSADRLSLRDGGGIISRTYSSANSGNLTIDVAGTIEVDGFVPTNPIVHSALVTSTFGSGSAGNLTVSTGNLRMLNGGNLSSATTSAGQAGSIHIQARDLIEIADVNPIIATSSAMASGSLGAGNANDLVINTSRLVIRNSGLLGSSSLASGSAGSVTVNASESIEVSGTAAGLTTPSRILAAVEMVDPNTQALLRLPPIPSGNSGSITINTPSLRITDGATVSVRNDGPGQAGDLQIDANSLVLEDRGSITASTASGNGGDITLKVRDSVQLRQGSAIDAESFGAGDGGNITIDALTIVGLENSDIIANAVQGSGGNIQINTQGIFGLENRSQLTDKSDITASSQFGISGNVTITNPDVEPGSGLVNLPDNVVDPSQQVVAGCEAYGDSQFIATGRGGVPTNPDRPLSSRRTWSDVRELSAFRGSIAVEMASLPEAPPEPLLEATGWQVRENGAVELVAAANPAPWRNYAASECNPLHGREFPVPSLEIGSETIR